MGKEKVEGWRKKKEEDWLVGWKEGGGRKN